MCPLVPLVQTALGRAAVRDRCTVLVSGTGCHAGTAFVLACVARPPGNNLCDSISFIICQGNYLQEAVGHLCVGLLLSGRLQ